MTTPLDHAAIEALIPHRGAMCLLERLLACDGDAIRCRVGDHSDPAHPLRSRQGLLAPAAIEFASQAMALHGALNSQGGGPARAGFLASARQVRLHVARLDDAPGPLEVSATRLAGDARQSLYRFALHDARARLLVDGRAAVVLDGTLPAPP